MLSLEHNAAERINLCAPLDELESAPWCWSGCGAMLGISQSHLSPGDTRPGCSQISGVARVTGHGWPVAHKPPGSLLRASHDLTPKI